MKKWQWKLLPACAAWGLLFGSAVLADSNSPPMPEDVDRVVRPASFASDAQFTRHVFFQEDKKQTPFREETQPLPVPDEAYDSPSDAPPDLSFPADVGIAADEERHMQARDEPVVGLGQGAAGRALQLVAE